MSDLARVTTSASEQAREARAIFIEVVLVLSLTLGQKPSGLDKARSLIREQLGRLTSREDNVQEGDVQPALLLHANRMLG